MHIPKCAGSSVFHALGQAVPAGTISPKRRDTLSFGDFKDFDGAQPHLRASVAVGDEEIDELSRFEVVAGHFSLPTLLRVTGASKVATVLREPRARILSSYAFSRMRASEIRANWPGYDAADHGRRPLDEFLSEPRVAIGTDNVMCRMLLGGHLSENVFIVGSDVGEVAANAIDALETLGYVGVLERGDSIWEGLSEFFGVVLVPAVANATASFVESTDALAAHDSITAHTLRLLDARTAADAILYRHALLAAGCSPEQAERVQATAFAAELVRFGDLIGASSAAARDRGVRIGEMTAQLQAKDEELRRVTGSLSETVQRLDQAEADLQRHRAWLAGLQGSMSWRLTAPLRAGKQELTRRWTSRRTQ